MKSPGQQQHPAHKVQESPAGGRMTVELDGTLLADSRDVVRVDEDGHPVRFYFPREDVRMEHLEPSATRTYCPFKGEANYFDIHLPDRKVADGVWSYEEPYEEHPGLRGRLAFDGARWAELEIRSIP